MAAAEPSSGAAASSARARRRPPPGRGSGPAAGVPRRGAGRYASTAAGDRSRRRGPRRPQALREGIHRRRGRARRQDVACARPHRRSGRRRGAPPTLRPRERGWLVLRAREMVTPLRAAPRRDVRGAAAKTRGSDRSNRPEGLLPPPARSATRRCRRRCRRAARSGTALAPACSRRRPARLLRHVSRQATYWSRLSSSMVTVPSATAGRPTESAGNTSTPSSTLTRRRLPASSARSIQQPALVQTPLTSPSTRTACRRGRRAPQDGGDRRRLREGDLRSDVGGGGAQCKRRAAGEGEARRGYV